MEYDDTMIHTKIQPQRDGIIQKYIIRSRKRDSDGMLIGTANPNRILVRENTKSNFLMVYILTMQQMSSLNIYTHR